VITTVLAFLLTLGVLIVVHEYGHYRTAVACGVKVLRFSVGFGRVIWRRQKSPEDTEFVICALPLGGYVRMLDEREGGVAPADVHRAFNRQPLSRRAAIVAAGPAANLGLAVLLFALAQWIGVEEPKALLGPPVAATPAERAGLRAGDWVRAAAVEPATGATPEWREVTSLTDLRWHVTQAAIDRQVLAIEVTDREGRSPRVVRLDLTGIDGREIDAQLMQRVGLPAAFSEPVLGAVREGGPAAAAGLKGRDRVIAVDGVPLVEAESLRQRIRSGAGVVQRWQVEREGRPLELLVQPRAVEEGGRTIGRIDAYVGLPPQMVKVRHGPVEGLLRGAERTWDLSALTVEMLGRMLIGEASIRNLSGPITIADYAGQSVQQGLAYYLGFLALVSVSLGVLNLLPLPMLDGGHLVYYIFEAVTGRPVSDAWLERLQRGGIVVLLAMMSVALYNDVARLLGLH
jgi:regulator of sigma E protease